LAARTWLRNLFAFSAAAARPRPGGGSGKRRSSSGQSFAPLGQAQRGRPRSGTQLVTAGCRCWLVQQCRLGGANIAPLAIHGEAVDDWQAGVFLGGHLPAAKSELQKTIIQRQIDATDAEIDRLVYELYGLTDAEIATVENSDKQ
jgi:hypothetical protein